MKQEELLRKNEQSLELFQSTISEIRPEQVGVQVSFNNNKQGKAEVYLNRSNGVQSSVSGSIRKNWDDDMKRALGIAGFPIELTPNPSAIKEVPAVPSHKNSISHLNEEIVINLSPKINISKQNSEKCSHE